MALLLLQPLTIWEWKIQKAFQQKKVMPEDLKNSSKEAQRKWLHNEVSTILEKFVMSGVSRLPNLLAAYNPRPDLPCREQGCTRVFKCAKCLVKHEKKRTCLSR